jgi:hypothetical protein
VPAAGPGKKLCGANLKAQGRTCRNVAGKGTDHLGIGRCSRHGGNTPNHVANARELQAREACQHLGIPITVDPGLALLEEVATARGAEEFYAAMVAQLDHHPTGGEEAIYMPVYASGQPTGRAEPHVLVRLWMEERERKATIAAAALKAGVALRMLDLAEDAAQRIARSMAAFATANGHDPEDATVKAAMREALQVAITNPLNIDGTAREIST